MRLSVMSLIVPTKVPLSSLTTGNKESVDRGPGCEGAAEVWEIRKHRETKVRARSVTVGMSSWRTTVPEQI